MSVSKEYQHRHRISHWEAIRESVYRALKYAKVIFGAVSELYFEFSNNKWGIFFTSRRSIIMEMVCDTGIRVDMLAVVGNFTRWRGEASSVEILIV